MCNIAAPRTGLEAKFSLRFNAALALYGEDTADSATYADQIVERADLEAARALVVVDLAPPDWPEDVTEVTITTRDGETLLRCHDVSLQPGDLALQAGRLHVKFVALTTPVIGREGAERLAAMIGRLERSGDAAELLRQSV